MIHDLKNKLVKEVKHETVTDPSNLMDPSQALDAFHFQNFFDAIRKGTPLHSDILSGHKSTLLVQLGNIAQRTTGALDIDPKNGHIVSNNQA
jgi:hypothetical protein